MRVAKCLSLSALMCGTSDPCKFESSWSSGWSDRQIIEKHKFDHSVWDSLFRSLNARDKNLVVLNVAWTLIWFCFLPGPPRRLVLRFSSGSPTVLSASCTADVKGRTILPLARRGLVAQITHVQCYGLLIRDLEILRQGRLRGRDFLSTKECSVILAGKHDSRRHSSAGFTENVVVVEASCQMLEVLSFFLSGKGLTSFNKINRVNFSGENRKTALSRLSIFSEFEKNTF